MSTNRRRYFSRPITWLAIGSALILSCRLATRGAMAGEGRAGDSSAEIQGHREVADAELALEKARRDAAAVGVKIAGADAEAAASEREFREKQHARIRELVERGSVDRLLLDEEEERFRAAQASERSARLGTEVARARLAAAEAAIREAQAVREIARTGSRIYPVVQAENELEDARSDRADAQHLVEQADAEEARASAFLEHRKKEYERLNQLAGRGAIEPRLIDEQQDRYRSAQADERQARAKVEQARASVAVADAAVLAARARCELARSVTPLASVSRSEEGPKGLKEALAQFRKARVERAGAEREVARLEVARLEARAKHEEATVTYRSKQVDRVKDLASRKAVADRLVDEHQLALSEARHLQRVAEAGVKSARARLRAAEDRLASLQAEADGGESGPR